MDHGNIVVTGIAHTNIALIKYWGKKDEDLKIPFSSSLSLTLDKFYTKTTIKTAEQNSRRDQVILNGILLDDEKSKRIRMYLNKVRKMYKMFGYLQITSENHVPTGAGLASSSSGFAALAVALNEYLSLNLDEKGLSSLARLGSGSAARSIYGGFSLWNAGEDHLSSYALPVSYHNDDIIMCIIIVDGREKKVSSTEAMRRSVESSSYPIYVDKNKNDLEEMLIAMKNNDFPSIGKIAQRNSDMMHEMIIASGINYYQDKTLEIIARVKELQKNIPAFYTIDAGPNVKVLTLAKYEEDIRKLFSNEEVIVSKKGVGCYVKH